MIIQSTEQTPQTSTSLEIVFYSDEEGEIIVDGEDDDDPLPNHILPNGILYEQENDDGLFEMDDLPSSQYNNNNNSSPSPVDMQVRYYAPTNEEPHGLSQSVIINDHDYLRRSIMNMRSSNYNMDNHSSYHRQQQLVFVPELVEDDDDYNYHEYENNNSENDHSLYTVPFPDTVNETIYSQSAPTRSFLFDLPNLLSSFEENNNNTSKEEEEEEEDEEIDDDNSTIGFISIYSDSSTGTIIHVTVLPQQEEQSGGDNNTFISSQQQQHDNDIISPQEQEYETGPSLPAPQVSHQEDESTSNNCPSPSVQDKITTPLLLSQYYEPSAADTLIYDAVATGNPLPHDDTTVDLSSPQEDEPSTSSADKQVQRDEIATASLSPQEEIIVTVVSSSSSSSKDSEMAESSQKQEADITDPSQKDELIVNYILSPDIATYVPLQQSEECDNDDIPIILSPSPPKRGTSSLEPRCSFTYPQDPSTSTYQQYIDNMLGRYQNKEDEYISWSKLASSHYKENNRIEYYHTHHQLLYQQPLTTTEEDDQRNYTWERMHYGPNAYRQITRNPFIFECIARHAFSIKVFGISRIARFKDIQKHFFDPNVVFIRYIRLMNCAYAMYRNYEEMVKAASRYNRTAICDKRIYCRPSYYGELDRDNKLNSEIISNSPRPTTTTKRHNNNYQRTNSTRSDSRDTFIPEHYGINQRASLYGRPYYAPNNNHCSVALCLTTTKTTIPTISNTRKMLFDYHPTQTVNTLLLASPPPYRKKVAMNQHHKYYFTDIFPNATSYLSCMTHYVVLKPWTMHDIQFSQVNGYWSFGPRNTAVMNFLFNNTPQVNLIFQRRGSQACQGYAVMKSEIMDLKSLSNQEIFGTPFQRFGRCYKVTEKSRSWRYVCRVEWKNREKTSLKGTGNDMNPWNKNIKVKYSKDCTILESSLGKKIVEKIISSHQN